MEKMVKELKTKLILYRVVYVTFLIIAIGTFLLGKFGILQSADTSNQAPLTGAYIGGAIAMIAQAIQAKKALKSEEKRKALFIAQTDERLLTIDKEASRLTVLVTFIVLLIAGSVFAYINEIIYYTLFSVLIVMLVIMVFSDLYFRKKY